MATILRCDGCDREFKEKRGNVRKVVVNVERDGTLLDTVTYLDLCLKCVSRVQRFIRDLTQVRNVSA